MCFKKFIAVFICVTTAMQPLHAQFNSRVKLVAVDSGWANNSINTVIFRKNSLCTYRGIQYIAYYNSNGYVVLGKRKLSSSKWQLQKTQFKGNVADAHNSISIITDGEGYLHMAWNHHGNSLHYSKSIASGSLQMTSELPMTGLLEQKVTYPEFYLLPDGNLLFFYRDGQSGQGNLVIKKYYLKEKQWKLLHSNLINGEQKRNAYWQACVDAKGIIYISWVWRDSPDVSSNHDMCYAKSLDGGQTWVNSTNEKYNLPITAASAEYICRIPQKSELINQTSMYVDESSNPFIVSYWEQTGDSIPQYHIIYNINGRWVVKNTGLRKTPFSLSGAGTKQIPISRPQIVAFKNKNKKAVAIIFRDAERENKVSAAISSDTNFEKWQVKDLSNLDVGSWEPTYDTELWKREKKLHLFVQHTQQADAEGTVLIPAQMIWIMEVEL